MIALDEAVAWVRQDPAVALGVALGLYLVLFGLIVVLLVRQERLARKQARLLRGADGANLEQVLLAQGAAMEALTARALETEAVGRANAQSLRHCLRKVGVVRYDAFADIGGQQSFSVALLDEGGDGVVLSGIHSRSDLRVYVKPVAAGGSPLTLTDEEQQAIGQAQTGVRAPDDFPAATRR